jgi:primosomal protein N' (replication factor Y)
LPAYCDVVVPVPLDQAFTYTVPPLHPPVVGGRVVVPFRNEKLIGIVTRLHDDPPAAPVDAAKPIAIKPIELVMDTEPILSADLMELGRWISQYYLAPLGEVLRTMLPLMAEVRKHVLYRITDAGRAVLFSSAEKGSSRRSRRTPEEQDSEYTVLNYLSAGEAVKVSTIRSATGATRDLLAGMLRKKWIARETEADARDARRLERYAVLVPDARLPKLNDNQQLILAELAAAGGTLSVEALRQLPVPESTLATLVRRELIIIEERPQAFHLSGLNHTTHELNFAQQHALKKITEFFEVKEGTRQFQAALLHGVTGSGKTAVYLAAMQHALSLGLSSILLVPEIGLTPAMAAQLYGAFGDQVALLHSALTPDERAEQWHRIRKGDARVVVGTRSAIFAPVAQLGLVIVDEEHDSSYKQEENPRYHARDVAVLRAKLNNATIVLGSATPSLESWQNAQPTREGKAGKYGLIEMHERVMHRPLPAVELIDMRREFQETGKEHIFSRKLIEETEAAMLRGEQAIILLNRRGYSFVVMCRACGEKIDCENCAISLTHHKAPSSLNDGGARDEDLQAHPGQRLECHYCGFRRTVPKLCPKCESEHLYFLGAGSQQGEERLHEIFPHARIGRMDRDTVRSRHDMERLLTRLHSGEINLLVGTQMIAKGHDIHGVTLVGVVGCDHALGLPDFRAAERVFQLLTQVSGRAGRGELPGKVIVQTYHPDHYAITCAQKHDFHGFVEKELKFRRYMHYPPFGVLANLLIQSNRLEEAAGWSAALGRWFQNTQLDGVRVLGPAAAPISKIKRIYRFHLVLKAGQRQALAKTLRAARAEADRLGIPRRNLIFDVDAVSLM